MIVERTKEGKFLSTPSVRRATDHVGQLDSEFQFLSTPSVRRATFGLPFQSFEPIDFYPRPP